MNKKLFLSVLMLLAAIGIQAQRLVGGDLSMLPKYEAAKVNYYDRNGASISDVLVHMHDEAGFGIVRVRLFVTPTGATGVVQDLDYVKTLGKRVKDAGMKLMVDFHYSDTWADPSNQWTPSKWTSLSDSELYQTIYEYTKDCLQQLTAAGAQPDYIQTGNEISYGMLWGAKGTSSPKKCYTSSDSNWERFRTLLKNAGKACREVCPQAKIVIHTERTNNWSTTKGIYERLSSVDYDVIGLSYYPEWHNNLATLKSLVQNLKNTYSDKPVMIVETGYCNNWYPSNATYNLTSTWPASAEGQKKFLTDLVETVQQLDNVTAIIYWFPEENPYKPGSNQYNNVYDPWFNHGLFNPETGRASEGLYALKPYSDVENGIETLEVSNDVSTSSSAVYTLDGRQLPNQQPLQPGIYIRDGRKVVVK
ncbi:MAG: arabinogalactan endo-1,4-beta-galactosidase [Prevotella sp.]|nr:arabinogalactan endo-1,4-beta-galactosidase [Prevotella sp.]